MKFINLPATADLVDRRYDRESVLRESGLKSFVPPLRLMEELSESPDELEEHRRFIIRNKKSELSLDGDFQSLLSKLRQEESERWERTKDQRSIGLTAFARRLRAIEVDNPTLWAQIGESCRKQAKALFAEEVAAFSSGMSHQFSEREPNARLNLYRQIMDNNALGFSYDKKQSGKGSPIYSKAICQYWSSLPLPSRYPSKISLFMIFKEIWRDSSTGA